MTPAHAEPHSPILFAPAHRLGWRAQRVLVVGAGLSGAVVARELADAGHRVTVIEARDHLAGNCHTERDAATGVMEHRYGPHIFHTDDAEVWRYVNRFAQFQPYEHRVRTVAQGQVYTMPVSLMTLCQILGAQMSPDAARAWLAAQCVGGPRAPRTFEEAALSRVGPRLYELLFKGYTEKAWGRSTCEVPVSVFERIPIRFDHDDTYFEYTFRGLPMAGYPAMVERMLAHPGIEVVLNTPWQPSARLGFEHVFFTGPIDAYFNYSQGRLPYRTLDFERAVHPERVQGCAVLNYADADIPHTRVTEQGWFEPSAPHHGSITYTETPREAEAGDIRYYPVRLAAGQRAVSAYEHFAQAEEDVTFLGRLGTFRYLDMDRAVRAALDVAARHIARARGVSEWAM